jgi:PLP dependent protein
VKKLLSVATLPERSLNLCIETVDSKKLAEKLNKEWKNLAQVNPLPVLVQVLSSDEDTKHGMPSEEVPNLVDYILKECPKLHFCGLMTMGKLHDIEGFRLMYELRSKLIA